jgi:hypothetical protein
VRASKCMCVCVFVDIRCTCVCVCASVCERGCTSEREVERGSGKASCCWLFVWFVCLVCLSLDTALARKSMKTTP